MAKNCMKNESEVPDDIELTKIIPDEAEADEGENGAEYEQVHILRAGLTFSTRTRTTRPMKTHLRFSIQPITFRLSPRVLAASSSRFWVPFSICRWSTRLFRTSWPCARKSSSLSLVFWMNVCSSKACASRAEKLLWPGPRNGDSATVSECCERRPGWRCDVELGGGYVGWNLLRASEGDIGVPETDISSERCAAAFL